MKNFCAFHAFLSMTDSKDHVEALREAYWINAKKEELDDFQRNKVWHLEPKPKNQKIIRLK